MGKQTETPAATDNEEGTAENTTTHSEEGGGPSPAGSANLDQIGDELSAGMPDVQEHAIEQEKMTNDNKLARYSHLKDRDGNSFDPAIHKTNKAGEPTLSTQGKLIKKPGRKPGQKTGEGQASIVSRGDPAQQKALESEALCQQMRATGAMSANMLITTGILLGGEEWHPRKDDALGLDEKLMLESAFADYFEATGKTDIPPGMVLSIAILGYAGPRFTMPKTQSRVSKAWGALKSWWINRKLKKHGYKAEPVKKPSNESDKPSKMVA